MPNGPVISNTSPLFYLHQVGQLDLLRNLYGMILIPGSVADELAAGAAKGLSVPSVSEIPWIEIEQVSASTLVKALADLGSGEAGVLALGASIPGSTLILDDQLGRQVAKLMGADVTGTLGVLLKAKLEGHLTAVVPWIQRLRASGMYVSDSLEARVAKLAGESSRGRRQTRA